MGHAWCHWEDSFFGPEKYADLVTNQEQCKADVELREGLGFPDILKVHSSFLLVFFLDFFCSFLVCMRCEGSKAHLAPVTVLYSGLLLEGGSWNIFFREVSGFISYVILRALGSLNQCPFPLFRLLGRLLSTNNAPSICSGLN